MSFLSAMQSAVNGTKAGGQSTMGVPPASLGFGTPPNLPNLPPKPENVGAMPVGTPGTTKKTAADDAITALRTFQGFAQSMGPAIEDLISQIKSAAKGETPKPDLGEPQQTGSPVQAEPIMESGQPGSM